VKARRKSEDMRMKRLMLILALATTGAYAQETTCMPTPGGGFNCTTTPSGPNWASQLGQVAGQSIGRALHPAPVVWTLVNASLDESSGQYRCTYRSPAGELATTVAPQCFTLATRNQ
jgi:hypothetical protein